MNYDYTSAVARPVWNDILDRLAATECEEQVTVLLAVESGSRAWGFPGADSDYDVRFIYARPRDWYLAVDLERRRDVIGYPITDLIDIGGWDLRKSLALLHRSNIALMEWLQSPIVYREQADVSNALRAMLPGCYSPVAAFHHYLSMAKGTFRDHLQEEHVRAKKYFYALRPLLAAMWIEEGLGPAPIEFGRLADRMISDPSLTEEIERLMERKRNEGEKQTSPRIPMLSEFIERELARLNEVSIADVAPKPDVEELNRFFRRTLADIEGDK